MGLWYFHHTQENRRCPSRIGLQGAQQSPQTDTISNSKNKRLTTVTTWITYAMAIDLSMGYYNIPLSKRAQELCTILLPWGKFRYKHLPMGIKTALDIVQRVMQDLLGDLPFVRVYMDDLLVLGTGSYEEHLEQVALVLHRLEEANFQARVDKCQFAVQEIEYLGYWLMPTGISPQPKKVEVILRLTPPSNKKQL